AFEVPVFVLGLVRLRILSAAMLRRTWRGGVFVRVGLGGILPAVDPVTTILSVIPLVVLYVLSIGLATFFEPRWRAERESAYEGTEFEGRARCAQALMAGTRS